MTGSTEGLGVEETPTYAVALVAFAFILISLLVERAIHRLGKYLKKTNQKPLKKALDKMTGELMLLGFISLGLTVLQTPLSRICVTKDFAKHLLPCTRTDYTDAEALAPEAEHSTIGKRLLNVYYGSVEPLVGPLRRLMASEEVALTGHCASKGKVPFVSVEVLHQLHILIFVLAITHVAYSLVTVGLGFARLHNWRHWEEETRRAGYDGKTDLHRSYCKKVLCEKPPLVGIAGHANAFVDRHANHWCYENPISIWVLCFFQQFFASVSREDYLTYRVGFLNKHNLGDSFNFRDYVIRSMEVDFKKVVGISWWLWLFAILFLLLNVHGWYTYFWAAFIPTIMVMVIGTKQQHIISTLALQAKRHAAKILAEEASSNIQRSKSNLVDVSGAVSPSDRLFWFDNPRLLLKLLHFVIFQNSFELAIFFWLLTSFGWNSCIMGNHTLLIIRLVIGIATQLLASYSTLPIYALVTQMGSTLKETVFTKNVFEGLQGWREKAHRNAEKRSSTPSSEENSQLGGNGSQVGSTEGSVPEHSVGHSIRHTLGLSVGIRLPSVPREGPHNLDDVEDPDPSLKKMCQLMYGKQEGLEKIKKAAIHNPSYRHHAIHVLEEEEQARKE